MKPRVSLGPGCVAQDLDIATRAPQTVQDAPCKGRGSLAPTSECGRSAGCGSSRSGTGPAVCLWWLQHHHGDGMPGLGAAFPLQCFLLLNSRSGVLWSQLRELDSDSWQ